MSRFYEHIDESIWSDMQDRSAGEKIRREDDVNLMDKDTLYDYIMSTYGDMCISVNNLDEYILVKIVRGYELSLHYKNNKIDKILSDGFDFGDSSEFDTKFKIVKEEKSLYEIFNLDGTVTNKTALDFIEFYYKNVIGDKEFDLLKKHIKEFVNSSDEYSLDSFCDYIKTKKILTVDNIMGRLIYFIKNNEDFYSDEINKVTKDINESIWSDMQDRSAGEKIRREDDVNNLDLNEFYEYIKEQYRTKVEDIDPDVMGSGNIDVLGVDITEDIILIYKPKRGHILLSWSRVKIPIPFFDELTDRFKVEHPNAMRRIITEKDGSCTNKTFVDVIDFFIMYKESMMNESIWSDIQDRSSGETVREEDITEEDKKEIDYIFNGFAYLIVYTDYEPTIDDFIKMMKEAYPDKDNSKYIAWVRSNWDKIYKDELDKKIQDNKKDVDKRINKYLNNFVGQVVYCEKYNVSIPDIKKFSDEIKHYGTSIEMRFVGKIRVDESWLDIFKKYVDENWNDIKKRINDFIVEENQKIVKTGFKKTPGKKICDILDEWWDSLGDEKDDIAWDEFGERAEEKYYEDHNPKYNEYTGEDFDADEEWSNASWIECVEIYMKYNQKTNESIWSDIQDRSSGETVRKEDEVLSDMEINSLNEFTLMYCRRERAHYIQNHIVPPPPSRRKENDYEGLIKYIEDRRDENLFTNVGDYDKIIKYIKKNWDKLDMDTYIKKWICSPDVMKGNQKIVECDGVPGGLTPTYVGGMGPAYFPGPNGEPGSGDLPSPTGIVYKQVAPFDTFIKMRRPKKNKKKKFRKEDEPCVHSPNAKVYDYVDDFRDYVDRTYNNIDRIK